MGMILLSFMIVQARYIEWASLLGVGLTAWEIIFFTNPLYQPEGSETTNMIKLFLKQMGVIGVCLLVSTHGKAIASSS